MTSLSNDLVVRFASYLDEQELGASFAPVCKRFGTKPQTHDDDDNGGAQTLAEQAAWLSFQERASDEERACLPLHDGESPLSLLRELRRLRARLSFDQLVGWGLSRCDEDGGELFVDGESMESTAISDHVMRAGRHFVTFEWPVGHIDLSLGIVWPMKGLQNNLGDLDYLIDFYPLYNANGNVQDKISSYRSNLWGNSIIGYMFNVPPPDMDDSDVPTYNWNDIDCSSWASGSIEEPCTSVRYSRHVESLSLLLDLDKGELLLYQLGQRCGKIVSGIQGVYCWAAVLRPESTAHITIERGDVPE